MPGKTLFIPAYWWYSIKFSNNASISCFNYRTYMNNVAVAPYIGMHALQIQNVKRNVVKKVSVDDINDEIMRPAEASTVQEASMSNESTNIEHLPNQAE